MEKKCNCRNGKYCYSLIYILYTLCGIGQREIINILGIKSSTLHNLLIRNKDRFEFKKSYERKTIAQDKVIDLYNDGYGVSAIAVALHCSHEFVSEVLESNGLREKRNRSCSSFDVDLDTLVEMFNNGMSKKDIAEHFGVSYRTIRSKLKGIDGSLSISQRDAKNKVLRYIKENSTLELVKYGLKKDEKSVFECKQCGCIVERHASSILKGHVSCPTCKKKLKEKKLKEKRTHYTWDITEPIVCSECGEEFIPAENGYTHTKKPKYCSAKCKSKHCSRNSRHVRRLRVKVKSDHPSWKSLYQSGETKCYLCGGDVDVNDYLITANGHFVAGKNFPSLDHVVPLSKGGTDTWDNAKMAHFYCNSIKSDRVISKAVR